MLNCHSILVDSGVYDLSDLTVEAFQPGQGHLGTVWWSQKGQRDGMPCCDWRRR